MEGAEDDDDEPEIPKNSAKTKRLCSTKGLKRTARGPGRGRKAKSPVAEDEEEDAPPKKRRGRVSRSGERNREDKTSFQKKKQDEEEEEQQPEEEAEEEKEPEIKKKSGRKAKADSEKDKDPKNLCGVGSRFCFCADMEKETNLHWVSDIYLFLKINHYSRWCAILAINGSTCSAFAWATTASQTNSSHAAQTRRTSRLQKRSTDSTGLRMSKTAQFSTK